MNKATLSSEIIRQLNEELAVLETSARAAHEAATHEESKPEDSHDTRGVEASYLAGAQRARIEVIKNTIIAFKTASFRDFSLKDPIAVGACVELLVRGRKSKYFLVEQGGGLSLALEGETIQVVSAGTPLGEAMIGRVVGEVFEIEEKENSPEYKVIALR